MARSQSCLLTLTCMLFVAACTARSAPEYATVTTYVGSGKIGPLGGGYADGPASYAQFHDPMGLAFDKAGNLYVSDWVNHRIRMIAPEGTVTTVAGGGVPGPYGDIADGPANSARFFGPEGLTIDDQGYIYVDVQRGIETLYEMMDDYDRENFDEEIRPYVESILSIGLASKPMTREGILGGVLFVHTDRD